MLIAWFLAPVFLSIMILCPGSHKLLNTWLVTLQKLHDHTESKVPTCTLHGVNEREQETMNPDFLFVFVFLKYPTRRPHGANNMLGISEIELMGSLSIFCRKTIHNCQRKRKQGYFGPSVQFFV